MRQAILLDKDSSKCHLNTLYTENFDESVTYQDSQERRD